MSEPATRTDNLKSVKELIAEQPNVDNTEVFERLKSIQSNLWTKITNRFPDLSLHDSTRKFQPYQSLDGSAKGDLKGYWSRRITDEHRIVYTITADAVIIISCKSHYKI